MQWEQGWYRVRAGMIWSVGRGGIEWGQEWHRVGAGVV